MQNLKIKMKPKYKLKYSIIDDIPLWSSQKKNCISEQLFQSSWEFL